MVTFSREMTRYAKIYSFHCYPDTPYVTPYADAPAMRRRFADGGVKSEDDYQCRRCCCCHARDVATMS